MPLKHKGKRKGKISRQTDIKLSLFLSSHYVIFSYTWQNNAKDKIIVIFDLSSLLTETALAQQSDGEIHCLDNTKAQPEPHRATNRGNKGGQVEFWKICPGYGDHFGECDVNLWPVMMIYNFVS